MMQEDARSQEEVVARLHSWRCITAAKERRCLSCLQPLPKKAEKWCPACRAAHLSPAAQAARDALRGLHRQRIGELDPQVVVSSINEVQCVVVFLTELLRPYPGERLVPRERLRDVVHTLRCLAREQPWLNDFPYHIDRFPLYTAELLLWNDPTTEFVALSPGVMQRARSCLLPMIIELKPRSIPTL